MFRTSWASVWGCDLLHVHNRNRERNYGREARRASNLSLSRWPFGSATEERCCSAHAWARSLYAPRSPLSPLCKKISTACGLNPNNASPCGSKSWKYSITCPILEPPMMTLRSSIHRVNTQGVSPGKQSVFHQMHGEARGKISTPP